MLFRPTPSWLSPGRLPHVKSTMLELQHVSSSVSFALSLCQCVWRPKHGLSQVSPSLKAPRWRKHGSSLVKSTESGKEPNAPTFLTALARSSCLKASCTNSIIDANTSSSLWRWTSEVTEVRPVQIPTSCHNANTKNQPNKRKERENQQSISKTQNNKQTREGRSTWSQEAMDGQKSFIVGSFVNTWSSSFEQVTHHSVQWQKSDPAFWAKPDLRNFSGIGSVGAFLLFRFVWWLDCFLLKEGASAVCSLKWLLEVFLAVAECVGIRAGGRLPFKWLYWILYCPCWPLPL